MYVVCVHMLLYALPRDLGSDGLEEIITLELDGFCGTPMTFSSRGERTIYGIDKLARLNEEMKPKVDNNEATSTTITNTNATTTSVIASNSSSSMRPNNSDKDTVCILSPFDKKKNFDRKFSNSIF